MMSGGSFEEFMNFIRRSNRNRNYKIGKKLVDLDKDDTMEHEIMQNKLASIKKEMETLDLRREQILLQSKEWWMRMDAKYKLADGNKHYEDGAIFEYVDADSDE